MPGRHTETAFEAAIEAHLTTAGGYDSGDREAFDLERCIDPATFLAFVQKTQLDKWTYLEIVAKHLLKKAYEQVRSERAEQQAARDEPFDRVTPREEDKYRTCVPVYTLKVAAGGFADGQPVEPDGWVIPKTSRRLLQGMFVARVVGRSMEPRIPDGAWCLFRSPVTGTRQGRIVLVQHRSLHDPEVGGSYTVKRYQSEKEADGEDSWRHKLIRLVPENPGFEPIVLKLVDEGEVAVIAELIEVLDGPKPGRGGSKG